MQDYTTAPIHIARAEGIKEFPEWARDVDSVSPTAMSKLASVSFADTQRRLLPIFDKQAAFLSAVDYVARPQDFDDDTAARLQKAAQSFGIEDEVAPYAELRMDALEKIASSDSINYAIEFEDHKLLPLNDAANTEFAAKEVWKMASEDRLPFIMLIESLDKIATAAEEFGAEISPRMLQLVKAADTTYPDWEKAEILIADRHKRANNKDMGEFAEKEYASIIKRAAAGELEPMDAALEISVVDMAAGVRPTYALKSASLGYGRVPTPIDIIFCGSDDVMIIEKMADENVLFSDVLIPVANFSKLPEAEVVCRLSKDAAERWKKTDKTNARDLSNFSIELQSDDVEILRDILLR